MPKKSETGGATAALTGAGPAYDPTCQVAVELRFDSPHIVTYHLWYALDDGIQQKFATGTDEVQAAVTAHRHLIGPYPAGTQVSYLVLFAGNPQTAFKGQLVLTQNGQMIGDGLRTFQGQTNSDGAAVARGEIIL
jgi:hypothetical protein